MRQQDGWTVGVIQAGRPDDNFAAIATQPYRGMNHRFVERGPNRWPSTFWPPTP